MAWRRLSRRSQLLSEALGAELLFFPDRIPYIRAAYRTMNAISMKTPDVVIVQLPQGPLLLEAIVLRAFKHFKVIADVHTGFLMRWEWKSLLLNTPFKGLLGKCDAVAIHNEKMRELLPDGAKAKAIVVYDPWFMIKLVHSEPSKEAYLVFPASYHPDEPLEEVLSAVRVLCPDVKIKITGNWRRLPEVKQLETENITFTGYLTNEEYEQLIANATGIISGTKEEYTTLMSAWEAVAYRKPLAITDSQALRESYGAYPTYYDWKNKKSIAQAINNLYKSVPDSHILDDLRKSAKESIEKLKSALIKGLSNDL